MRRLISILSLSLIGFAPLSAQACQLMCFLTNTTYNGSTIGGLSGADAKCAAEFSGFRFVRNGTIAYSLPSATSLATDLAQNFGYAWVGSSAGSTTNTCSNFTSTSGNGPGLRGSSGALYSGTVGCGNSYPLLCCNM